MEEIKITIKADGKIEYGVTGVKGKTCTDLTKMIDEIAGGSILDRKQTGEACQLPNQQRIGGK